MTNTLRTNQLQPGMEVFQANGGVYRPIRKVFQVYGNYACFFKRNSDGTASDKVEHHVEAGPDDLWIVTNNHKVNILVDYKEMRRTPGVYKPNHNSFADIFLIIDGKNRIHAFGTRGSGTISQLSDGVHLWDNFGHGFIKLN